MRWGQGVKRLICVATSSMKWDEVAKRRKEEKKIGARAIDHLSKAALEQMEAQSPQGMFRGQATSEERWWRNEGKFRGHFSCRLWV